MAAEHSKINWFRFHFLVCVTLYILRGSEMLNLIRLDDIGRLGVYSKRKDEILVPIQKDPEVDYCGASLSREAE